MGRLHCYIKIKLILLFILLVPALCFSQSTYDSTNVVRAWNYSDDGISVVRQQVDTLPDLWSTYNPLYRSSISNTWLGNIGLAGISNLYFTSAPETPFIFFRPFATYATPDCYYNTRKHFTGMKYFTNANKERNEQDMEIVHAQNINPFFNAGFRYKLFSSLGQYLKQTARDNSLSFFSSYARKHYEIRGTFRYNKFRVIESGGIVSDQYILSDSTKPQLIPVMLENARNIITTKSLQLVHGLRFGPTDSLRVNDSTVYESFIPKSVLLHTLNFEMDKKIYTDDNPGYYADHFYDTVSTRDSSGYRKFGNYLQYRKHYFSGNRFPGFFISAGNELTRYHSYGSDTSFSDFVAAVCAYRDSGIWQYRISGQYYFSGHRQGNIHTGGSLAKIIPGTKDSSEVALDASFRIISPSWFEERFYSNHIRWENDFLNKQETKITLKFLNKKHALDIGIQAAILDNFVYFDSTAHAKQTTSTFNVYSVYLSKLFKAGRWRFMNHIVWQQTGNKNVLPFRILPFIIPPGSDFEMFKKVLLLQPGFDIYYNSAFYTPGYMPATNLFCIQQRKTYGNYPWLNIFLNVQLTSRFFLKLEHANQGLMENNYLSTAGYPLYRRSMRIGISWNFYD